MVLTKPNGNRSEECMARQKDAQTTGRTARLVVLAENDVDWNAAQLLADHLQVEAVCGGQKAEGADLVLRMDEDGLALVGGELVLRGDFTRMLPRLRIGNLQRELLVRAAKVKKPEGIPVAVDATAGLGEDALLLAAAGFSVRLYEYDPVIAALLKDTLRRASQIPELAPIVGRMEVREENSLTALPQLAESPDVILLDPMFPERQKSALIKKKFQLLQQLESPCAEEDALVHAAMEAHPRKIVIKRPLKGPNLAGIKPSHSLKGKAIRYDCLVLPR